MTAQTPVRLTKLVTDRDTGPAMLKTGYWLEGTLAEDLNVGRPIVAHRTARAGRYSGEPERVEMDGVFTSSPVLSLTTVQDSGTLMAQTNNSVWLVETI